MTSSPRSLLDSFEARGDLAQLLVSEQVELQQCLGIGDGAPDIGLVQRLVEGERLVERNHEVVHVL